jgi:peptidoglycan-N-acetylglucosamine deacetylase
MTFHFCVNSLSARFSVLGFEFWVSGWRSVAMLAAAFVISIANAAQPIPDKLVVLTFDDSSASHHAIAAPLLKRYGFGATFFITEGFTFPTNKRDYMTWEQIAELHRDGFEIGNHTRDHMGVTVASVPRLAEQLEAIAARCREYGIPVPVSFAWPGNRFHASALPVLQSAGIRFARRGGEPEVPYALGGGVAYEPGADHPLLIPTTGDARPDWTLDNLKRAVALGGRGRIPVLQFHGVPDGEHPWVNTPRERFEEYMAWLKRESFTVIALRDLVRYTEGKPVPADPLAIMERRKRAAAAAPVLRSSSTCAMPRRCARGAPCSLPTAAASCRAGYPRARSPRSAKPRALATTWSSSTCARRRTACR